MAAGKTKKYQVAIYVSNEDDLDKVNPEGFIRVGKSTQNTITCNPTTNTYDFIDQKEPTTEIESYSFAMEHDVAMFRGNEDYEFAFEKMFYGDVGDDAKGTVLIVFMDHEQPAGVYKAFISAATFSISQMDAVAGTISLSIAFNGTRRFGIVKSQNKKPVFTEAPEAPSVIRNENIITIATATEGAVVKYTDNGKDPVLYGVEYKDAITLAASKRIKAVAIKDDAASRVVSHFFDVVVTGDVDTPPPEPTITQEGNSVTIESAGADAIYYTDDGTDPSSLSNRYTEPITLTETKAIKAIAFKGDAASAVSEKECVFTAAR